MNVVLRVLHARSIRALNRETRFSLRLEIVACRGTFTCSQELEALRWNPEFGMVAELFRANALFE